jgi:F0F1-type ATP synthase assembly protein I
MLRADFEAFAGRHVPAVASEIELSGPIVMTRANGGPGSRDHTSSHEQDGKDQPGQRARTETDESDSTEQAGGLPGSRRLVRIAKSSRSREGSAYQGAMEAVFAIVIASLAGYWADEHFGTTPRWLIVGVIIGFASFVLRLLRMADLVEEPETVLDSEAARAQEGDQGDSKSQQGKQDNQDEQGPEGSAGREGAPTDVK